MHSDWLSPSLAPAGRLGPISTCPKVSPRPVSRSLSTVGRLITSGRIMKQGQQGNPALPTFHTSMIQAMPRIRATSQSKQKPITTPVQEESISQGQSSQTESRDSNVRTVQLSINGQSREVPLPNQVSN